MTNLDEEPGEEKKDEVTEEETEEPREEAPIRRPPQIVEIKTPLDRPEFDWFLETFMKKLGLTDRKQSAIMLTNMMYDMGLDPYEDIKDLQQAMEEMNTLIKNLPNTPMGMKVKDTLATQMAVKTGRQILNSVPRMRGQDEMYERMEKIMDKYMPMIMGMKMVSEMMRSEPGERGQPKVQTSTEVPPAFKAEIDGLKEQVANLTEMISKQSADEHDKQFAASVIGSVNATIVPQLQTLQAQIDAIAKQPSPVAGPDRSEELRVISQQIKEAVDKLGEKAGQKNLTFADLDSFLSVLDKVQERVKKEPTGDMDWRTATISTLGETMKEGITAFKEVESAKAAALGDWGSSGAAATRASKHGDADGDQKASPELHSTATSNRRDFNEHSRGSSDLGLNGRSGQMGISDLGRRRMDKREGSNTTAEESRRSG